MSRKSFRQAINEALAQEMRRDPRVVVMGEDVAGGMGAPGEDDAWGGPLGVTKGLMPEFGRERVLDTPITESGFIGAAIGAAATGLRPVADLMFVDFLGVCFDQIFNQAAKFRYMFGGKATTPVVIRTMWGAGFRAASQHSQALYLIFTHIPGLKVVVPSNAYDAKGLMIQAIRDDDPVIFMEHKMLYDDIDEVPDEPYTIRFGEANVTREGEDVTIVAIGRMVKLANEAADLLAREKIACTVIDPRTTSPLDSDSIVESVEETGRLVIVDEASPRCNMATDISALVAEHAFEALKGPIRRVTPPHVPVPFSPALEDIYIPSVARIADAARRGDGRPSVMTPIGMPKWGLAMTEGKVSAWLVEEGAHVNAGDEIVEIETSKITNVFESPAAGTLRRRVAAEGETLPVGALLGVLADADVSDKDLDAFVAAARAQQEQAAAAATPPPEPVLSPAAGWTVRSLRMGEGSATPLLLIHGFGGDLLSWQMNQPEWAADRPVVAIDLPGHGGSSKIVPDPSVAGLARMVAAAMDALALPRAHLAGHSLGGAIALQLALDHPDRVASVTLVCSAALGPEINQAYIDGFIAADRRRELKSVVEALFADPGMVTREMVDDLLKSKRLDGVDEALRGIAGAVFADGRQATMLRDRLTALRAPVLAIWGAEDRIIPVAHAGAVPEQHRHVVAGAGHMVHLEKAETVTQLVRSFLAAA